MKPLSFGVRMSNVRYFWLHACPDWYDISVWVNLETGMLYAEARGPAIHCICEPLRTWPDVPWETYTPTYAHFCALIAGSWRIGDLAANTREYLITVYACPT